MNMLASGIATVALLVARRAFNWLWNPPPAVRPIPIHRRVLIGVGGGFAVATDTALPMPRTKGDAQKVLRAFGLTGLKIDSIATDRIFALTTPQLQGDGRMTRRAVTVLLTRDEIKGVGLDASAPVVRADSIDGWIVD